MYIYIFKRFPFNRARELNNMAEEDEEKEKMAMQKLK